MSSARKSRRLFGEQSHEEITLNAQLTGFTRLTPTNSLVNISVSLVTGAFFGRPSQAGGSSYGPACTSCCL